MSYRIFPAALLLIGCAHRGPAQALHVDRMAELDRIHAFQDLKFNTPCAPEREVVGADAEDGLELARTNRRVSVAPGAEGSLMLGCYKGLLGQATVELDDKRSVKRARETLVNLYGAPDETTPDGLSATWRGDRVVLSMRLGAEQESATVTYRSRLTEALFARDQLLADRQANPLPDRAGERVATFRLSHGGLY